MVDAQMKVFPVWDGAGEGWTPAPRSEVEKRVDPTNYVPDELALEVFEITAPFTPQRAGTAHHQERQSWIDLPGRHLCRPGPARKVLREPRRAPKATGLKIAYGEQTGWVCGKYADWAFNMQPNWFEQDDCRYLPVLALSGGSG